jgi:hypothetical protein
MIMGSLHKMFPSQHKYVISSRPALRDKAVEQYQTLLGKFTVNPREYSVKNGWTSPEFEVS